MGTSMRGKSPHEADTGTVIPVSGAGGGSAPRKRSEATTTPIPRAVLFYTLRPVHGADTRRFHISNHMTGGLNDGDNHPA